MNKKVNEKIVADIVSDAERINNLSASYISNELKEEVITRKFNKKTTENVVRWALKGASMREIAENLELSQKEFDVLLSSSPALMWALQKGEALAQVYLSMTAYEIAIGGKRVKKEVLSTIRERDENGRVVKEYQVPVEVSYELPPDSAMMKFLLQNHIPNRYGDIKKQKEDEEMRTIIDQLSDEDKINISKYGKEKINVNISDLLESATKKGNEDDDN